MVSQYFARLPERGVQHCQGMVESFDIAHVDDCNIKNFLATYITEYELDQLCICLNLLSFCSHMWKPNLICILFFRLGKLTLYLLAGSLWPILNNLYFKVILFGFYI